MAEVLGLTIKVAIITGQYLVWIGLQTILESSNRGFQVVGNPSQCITSPELLTECRPDVIIIDMETERDAIKSIAQLRESSPDSKVLLLSGFEGKDPVREALECGVDGVILKIHPPQLCSQRSRRYPISMFVLEAPSHRTWISGGLLDQSLVPQKRNSLGPKQ